MARLLSEQSGTVWLLQLGMLVNFFGNGLVAPFIVLYLHLDRGIPLPIAAAAIAAGGLAAVASGLLAGWSADRFGPKRSLVAAMTSNAFAYALYLLVSEPWQAFAVSMLVGVGTGMYGPSQQSLVAVLVPTERRHRVFTQNRMFALVGLGSGGIVGGGILAAGGSSAYEILLGVDVVTFLAFAAILSRIQVTLARVVVRPRRGYLTALRDRDLLGLALINLVLVSAGIAPMLVLMPAYAKLHGGVGLGTIGAIFAVNIVTVLAAQIPITRFGEGRRRMPFLAAGTVMWILSWGVLLLAVASQDGWVVPLIAVAIVLYALGECVYSAVVVPTVAAIAPEHLRGRYLAVLGLSWQAGFVIGPAAGGVLVAIGPAQLPLAAALACGAALLGALRLDRGLPAEHRRTPVVSAVPTEAAKADASRSRRARMKWITRERPRVDRVACPWLIERFIDRDAEFLYVRSEDVLSEAARLSAVPYDVKGVELGHHGPECSFDAFVTKYGLGTDPALAYMARVIRGADTTAKDLTPESRGIEALLDGIRELHQPDDQLQRAASRPLLDALYAYCRTRIPASA